MASESFGPLGQIDAGAAAGKAYAKRFTGEYSHGILSGISHRLPQEDQREFTQAIIDVDRL